MFEADQIVDLLTMAGVLAMIAVPFLAMALAFAGRLAWGQAKDRHAAEMAADRIKRRLEDVEAIRVRDAVWRPTHRHADGGAYRLEREANGKHPDTGEWVEGVIYSGEDGEWRWTDAARWAMRFTRLIRGFTVTAPPPHLPETGRDGTDVRDLPPLRPGDQLGYFDMRPGKRPSLDALDEEHDGEEANRRIMLDGEVEADRLPSLIREHLGPPPFNRPGIA